MYKKTTGIRRLFTAHVVAFNFILLYLTIFSIFYGLSLYDLVSINYLDIIPVHFIFSFTPVTMFYLLLLAIFRSVSPSGVAVYLINLLSMLLLAFNLYIMVIYGESLISLFVPGLDGGGLILKILATLFSVMIYVAFTLTIINEEVSINSSEETTRAEFKMLISLELRSFISFVVTSLPVAIFLLLRGLHIIITLIGDCIGYVLDILKMLISGVVKFIESNTGVTKDAKRISRINKIRAFRKLRARNR